MANIAGAVGLLGTAGGLISNISGQKFALKKGGKWSVSPNDIRSHIDEFGIQKQSLGMVLFQPPTVIRQLYSATAVRVIEGVWKRTDQFNVPGSSIQTSDVRRYGYGPTNRVPVGNVTSSNFTLNMVGDKDGAYYKVMRAWMDGVVHHNGRSKMSMATRSTSGGRFLYEVSYMEDYAVDIMLMELNERYDEIMITKLIKAYPVGIQDKQMSWSNQGLVTFNVEFAYTAADTIIEDIKNVQVDPLMTSPAKKRTALYANIVKGLSVLQSFSSAKKGGGIANVVGVVAAGAAALNVVGGLRR